MRVPEMTSSLGHVCDLEAKKGAIDVDKDFELNWEVSDQGHKQLDRIASALKSSSRLVLATDPDREGEAISWHVLEQLKATKKLKPKNWTATTIERITFNQITKDAILEALSQPRTIDERLVDAYLARRVIDHLLGFSLSPVLWRKLPGARSAGRVQSPCLRLICEREDEIIHFIPVTHWSVEATLKTKHGRFEASLTHLNGQSLKSNPLKNEEDAEAAVTLIKDASLFVKKLFEKKIDQKPLPPYRTSTLQQDAAVKLKWNVKRTMDVAQSLYEGRNNQGDDGSGGGLITYMRTDGVTISDASIKAIRDVVRHQYGSDYVPEKKNIYVSKVRNAQEAHEAIHPIDMTLTPDQLPRTLDSSEKRLYRLIWQRTVSSQMSKAQYLQKTAVIADEADDIQLSASARTTTFKGFTAVYEATDEGVEDTAQENAPIGQYEMLSQLTEGEEIESVMPTKSEHSTRPPPRYTEASIVKTMEALGIGRPSTFANITATLVTRQYVRRNKQTLFPKPLGRVASVYLKWQFQQFTDAAFTSMMESRLDDIAEGKENWKSFAKEFWDVLQPSVQAALKVPGTDMVDYINNQVLQSMLLPLVTDGRDMEDLLKCPECDGTLLIMHSRYGPFLGCRNYRTTQCNYKQNLSALGMDKKEAKETTSKSKSKKTTKSSQEKTVGTSKSATHVTKGRRKSASKATGKSKTKSGTIKASTKTKAKSPSKTSTKRSTTRKAAATSQTASEKTTKSTSNSKSEKQEIVVGM